VEACDGAPWKDKTMSSKMLIDASHPEETRVVVVRGNKIEEFDYESQHRKQLKGNIYLARVTRVEPSLQAAFVEYGGNRHGFLAFAEIHPDYYQIPVADRQALLAEEAAAARSEDEDDEDDRGRRGKPRRGKRPADRKRPQEDQPVAEAHDGDAVSEEAPEEFGGYSGHESDDHLSSDVEVDGDARNVDADDHDDEGGEPQQRDGSQAEAEGVESVGEEDALEEVPVRRTFGRKQYKIQEVIKRRQILLVQVVKEERGNKGAALTTYLSLAGRYSVLMPNTARGGGISRKITSAADRKRLRDIVEELEVPQGMGVILRTNGANRTKVEVKRDYEYLMRMWDSVRETTLASSAPCLVYEEGSLIKRSIRDLYGKDIDEVLVAGEEGYREAKDFMRMLMPSHAKAVQPYREAMPIFSRNGIEAHLDRMLQPHVQLKSGGYIIINQTEALVSVDVNSGRSTREHSIESTALQTNLEAAEEVARQLRLRDLAGLIVIDFIDMMESRNNRAVEKRLKDHLKNDRARIQVGRISHFGLLEMSRQRIRASVLESTMQPCPHCAGTGMIRSESSHALHSIRHVEEALLKDARTDIILRLAPSRALALLNGQRKSLLELEARFGVTIRVEQDATLSENAVTVARGGPATPAVPRDFLKNTATPPIDHGDDPEIIDEELADVETDEDDGEDADDAHDDGNGSASADGQRGDGGRGKRRRRRRRGGKDRVEGTAEVAEGAEASGEEAQKTGEARSGERNGERNGADRDGGRRKRRRGRRSGRRNRGEFGARRFVPDAEPVGFTTDELSAFEAEDAAADAADAAEDAAADAADAAADAAAQLIGASDDAGSEIDEKSGLVAEPVAAEPEVAETKAASQPEANPAPAQAMAAPEAAATQAAETRPARRRSSEVIATEPVVTTVAAASDAAAEAKPKGGWWRKGGGFL
jgi:ribonuclease E